MHTTEQLRSAALIGTKHLRLSCGLEVFPDEIFSLADSLETLDLSGNKLSELPMDFGRLKKLKTLFMSDNRFTILPAVLSDCPELDMIGFKSNQIQEVPPSSIPMHTRWLILTNNKITHLPASIGQCQRLQKVALAGNRLTALPDEMANCKNLELLRISANQLSALPDWLTQLPKLSWLAFAGNTFCKIPTLAAGLPQIPWKNIALQQQLGEGASGHIYKATYTSGDSVKDIAIKIYKGEVTSDGLPEDEMRAAILAGTHPNFVKLLGKIDEHPQGKEGLVMELIPPTFHNLGLPPSRETCSRDTFENNTVFNAEQIFRIVSEIASAVTQLHAKGLMHGDLYAHNILIDENAKPLFTDFGAASSYSINTDTALRLEQIEVRAFGCLLDDLLQHISEKEKDLSVTTNLWELRDALMTEKPATRPVFRKILARLKKITVNTDE